MSPNPQNSQPPPCPPPFQWHQLTPDQQRQLCQLLARLLAQYLSGSQKLTKREVLHEQSSQNR